MGKRAGGYTKHLAPLPEQSKAAAVLEARRAAFADDLKAVLSTVQGRSLFHQILCDGHMWSSVSSPQGSAGIGMSAQRDLVLGYYRKAKRIAPELVQRMEAEHANVFRAISDYEGGHDAT